MALEWHWNGRKTHGRGTMFAFRVLQVQHPIFACMWLYVHALMYNKHKWKNRYFQHDTISKWQPTGTNAWHAMKISLLSSSGFPIDFIWFPLGFPLWFSLGFIGVSYGFPIWISYGLIFLARNRSCASNCFLICSLCFCLALRSCREQSWRKTGLAMGQPAIESYIYIYK